MLESLPGYRFATDQGYQLVSMPDTSRSFATYQRGSHIMRVYSDWSYDIMDGETTLVVGEIIRASWPG